ncbi:MAG: prolyl oligopeptidase family serine peptidase, partial [Gemmatimonadetes bacterium]|nr:prolyl oligopeptidase family serine peptidase [Gemmatimonadota bacterium]
WSPDGTRIAFASNRTEDPDENYDTDVWIVSADRQERAGGSGASAAGRTTSVTLVSPGAGSARSPVWSPDGTTLAWLTNLRPEIGGYGMSHLAVGPPGGEPQILTRELDRNVSSLRFSQDGKGVYALLESEGSQSLVSIPVDGGHHEVLWGGRRRVEAFEPLPDGRFVARASTADAPSELWLLETDGSARQLTRHNDDLVAELDLGPVTKQRVRASDGTELDAFYTFPPNTLPIGPRPTTGAATDTPAPTSPLPTILWIHGGPMGQDSWGWHGLRQLFAAQGYLVVQPNYRGSHGYGQDFALGLWQDWGGPERVDAVAAIDHAVERGWADPDRLGVGGWSYGAITTNAIITHTDRFSAAVSGAGAALHVASWGHDQYQRWYTQELGYPWENHALWDRLSPFFRVAEITTPTLWMGGEHDWNVPILQSEIMYQSMKALGRETLLVVYPDQGHGGFPPFYEADRYRRFLGWFGRYLLGDDDLWPGDGSR